MKVCLTIIAALLMFSAKANNITVTNLTIKGQNSTNDNTYIQFDLNWDNSWRTTTGASNWDAAWVFVKFRIGAGGWQHAYLNNTGHTHLRELRSMLAFLHPVLHLTSAQIQGLEYSFIVMPAAVVH